MYTEFKKERMDMGVSREPFNHKRASRTMDEPANIWDKMQADDERWSRHARRHIHLDWTYVIVLLAIAAVFIAAVFWMKG